jgi:hypothetical protein
VALLDNIKKLRFSSAELESLITNDLISGRALYVGEGCRPNTLTWFLTLNSATLSKDLAQRCVIIRLNRPPYDATWEGRLWAYIDERRWEIIGDIVALLKAEKPKLEKYTRWGPWEQEVLTCVPYPEACQSLIARRQAAVDGDQEDTDNVREAFYQAIKLYRGDPDKEVLFIKGEDAAQLYSLATGKDCERQTAANYVKALDIPELRKTRGGVRKLHGFRWTGHKADAKARAVSDRQLPELVFDAEAILRLFPNRLKVGRNGTRLF